MRDRKSIAWKGDVINILEELSGAQLGIYYEQEIAGINDNDIKRAVSVKMERLTAILNNELSQIKRDFTVSFEREVEWLY